MSSLPPDSGVVVRELYADLSRPAEVQAKALKLEEHVKKLLQRVREEVFAIQIDELEVYRDLQDALDLLAQKRPEAVRCPYRPVRDVLDLIALAHEPGLKQASVAPRRV
jgi:hypothetical protein